MANGITSAATPAAQAAISGNVLNQAEGYPTTPRWPGAINPAKYATGQDRSIPGGASGPVAGQGPVSPFIEETPRDLSGGGWQDTTWMSGHDAPMVPWDNRSHPDEGPDLQQTYPGATDPSLHGTDTGGVYRKEHAVPAAIGKLIRRTMVGQTTVRASGDLRLRDGQTSPNDRVDRDQQQWHDPDGFDPHHVPYSERPVLNNLAYAAVALTPEPLQYVPSGALPNNEPRTYAAQAYQEPADPYIGAAPSGGDGGGIGGGWV